MYYLNSIGLDFNAKPARFLINGGLVMFKIGFKGFFLTFMVFNVFQHNVCQATNDKFFINYH